MEIAQVPSLPPGAVPVLDRGYVRLVDKLGSDLTVVNAARVSFDKESKTLTDKDRGLIDFLARNDHGSPFRHAVLQFEVYAPLMVCRQWWKYRIGSTATEQGDPMDTLEAWNESSRRYVTEEPTFYVPDLDEWRAAPENKKQGSGAPVKDDIGMEATHRLQKAIDEAESNYAWALAQGISAEQARLFLPAYGMYVRWYWTASLAGVGHFLNQRLEHAAQKEIQDYAQAVLTLSRDAFPESLKALLAP